MCILHTLCTYITTSYVFKKTEREKERETKKRSCLFLPFFLFFFFFLFFLVFFRKPLRVKISLALDDFASRFKSKASGIRAQRIVRPLVFNVRRLKRSSTQDLRIYKKVRGTLREYSSLFLSLFLPLFHRFISICFNAFFAFYHDFPFFPSPPLSFDAINLFPLIRFDQVESLPLYTFFPLLPVAI